MDFFSENILPCMNGHPEVPAFFGRARDPACSAHPFTAANVSGFEYCNNGSTAVRARSLARLKNRRGFGMTVREGF
jgi:hypothetical protein